MIGGFIPSGRGQWEESKVIARTPFTKKIDITDYLAPKALFLNKLITYSIACSGIAIGVYLSSNYLSNCIHFEDENYINQHSAVEISSLKKSCDSLDLIIKAVIGGALSLSIILNRVLEDYLLTYLTKGASLLKLDLMPMVEIKTAVRRFYEHGSKFEDRVDITHTPLNSPRS